MGRGIAHSILARKYSPRRAAAARARGSRQQRHTSGPDGHLVLWASWRRCCYALPRAITRGIARPGVPSSLRHDKRLVQFDRNFCQDWLSDSVL